MTRTFGRMAATAACTSRKSGSPRLPGSFVRSSAHTVRAVAGRAASRCSAEKGRYRRTFTRPTFSPASTRARTVASTVSQLEAMVTMTRSASAAPT